LSLGKPHKKEKGVKQFLSVLFFFGAGNLLFALGAPDGAAVGSSPALLQFVPLLVIVAIVFLVIKRISRKRSIGMDLLGLLKKKDGVGIGMLIDPHAGYRTEEQEKAVFYFSDENKLGCFGTAKGCFQKPKKKTDGGCFPAKKTKGCFPKKPKYVSDAEYDSIVKAVVDRLDLYHRALAKLNIDESQVKEINPITFENFKYRSVLEQDLKDPFFWKIGEDGLFRSNIYESSWLFFSADQVFAYQITLSTDWEKHDERTYEYHYKDITAFGSTTIREDVIKDEKKEYQVVKNLFEIIVPGDKFSCVLRNKSDEKEEASIQAMKAMLREKKG
jgi:hypothetical protein